MTLRRRLIPVTALVVAIGASAAGAATAASTSGGSGKGGPATPATKPLAQVVTCKDAMFTDKENAKSPDGKKKGSDLAKVAAQLGVTEKQLDDALVASKEWAGETGDRSSPAMFLQHVADLLHLPVAKVTQVLEESGVFRADQPSKADQTDKAGKTGKTDQNSKTAPSGK